MPRLPINLKTLIWLAPWLVMSACLVITALVWNAARLNETQELQLVFNAEVKDIHTRIDERLDDYSDILQGVAGLFAASLAVDRPEFRAYVEKLHLEQTYPGIQGVGFARLIAPAGRTGR